MWPGCAAATAAQADRSATCVSASACISKVGQCRPQKVWCRKLDGAVERDGTGMVWRVEGSGVWTAAAGATGDVRRDVWATVSAEIRPCRHHAATALTYCACPAARPPNTTVALGDCAANKRCGLDGMVWSGRCSSARRAFDHGVGGVQHVSQCSGRHVPVHWRSAQRRPQSIGMTR